MPSSHLRKGRYSEPGHYYLVTAIVANRAPVFSDLRAGRLLVTQFRLAHEQSRALSKAWVVMPDHFHWLIQLQSGSLSDLVARVKACSARAVNAQRQSAGKLWQSGFHDRGVRTDEELKHIARYIIANPLRANLVERIGDYPLWDAVWL
ncbi:Transposase IS200 like protein [compost metagenome]